MATPGLRLPLSHRPQESGEASLVSLESVLLGNGIPSRVFSLLRCHFRVSLPFAHACFGSCIVEKDPLFVPCNPQMPYTWELEGQGSTPRP